MKKILVNSLVAFLIIAVLFAMLPLFSIKANGDSMQGITFKNVSTLDTVKQDADLSSFEDLSTLNLSGAKGETEGVQFVVEPSANINKYDLTASDLICGSYSIESNKIKIYTELYTYASNATSQSVGTYGAGIYPDCLIPINYIKQAGENTIKAGNNQGFWIDVKIPDNIPAGVYTGNITFKADGSSKNIPISLEVYDFTMPSNPGIATCYLIWDWLLSEEFDNTTENYWNYYNTLLDYNITGYVFPNTSAKDFASSLKKYYEKVNMYGIPYRTINRLTNDWDYYCQYMLAIGEQCKKDNINYFDKAYYYFDTFYDEVLTSTFGVTSDTAQRIISECDDYEEYVINTLFEQGIIPSKTCEIANSIRNIKHAVTTENYINDVWPHSNMYVQHSKGWTDSASNDKYEELLNDDNYTIWNYTTALVNYPNPGVEVSDIPVSARDVFWFDYERGISGELYWCVNGNVNCQAPWGLGWAPIYDIYSNASHEGETNGGGYYLYPGMTYGSKNPFPSMRLAVKRDGIDDYTYMTELEKRYKSVGCSDSANKVVSFMNELLIKTGRTMSNSSGLLKSRENLAKLITLFDKYGVVLKDIYYTDNDIKVSLCSTDNLTIKINEANVSSESVGGKKVYNYTINEFNGITIDVNNENIVLQTKSASTLIKDFESGTSKFSVIDKYGSSSISTAKSRNGSKSNMITLNGQITDKEKDNINFKPYFYFEASNLGLQNGLYDSNELYFYVYSDDTVQREYSVLVWMQDNGMVKEILYDNVILKPQIWNKISISNYDMISFNKNDLKKVYRIGLRTDNIYRLSGSQKIAESVNLYIDDVSVRR